MKRAIALIFTVLSVGIAVATTPPRLGAYLSQATFNIPGDSPYAEIYLEIIGNSIIYKQNNEGKFQGSVQVTMIIRQDSVIKDYRKFELFSPEFADSTDQKLNFIDQQRFILKNGKYDLDLSISDINVDKEPIIISYPISIDFPPDKISVSGIQLIENYSKTIEENILSKSGYDFIPFVDNFFPVEKSKLIFYSEIYNPLHKEGSDDKFLVSAFIESFENRIMLNDYVRIRRESSRPVMVLLSEFDISNLPSGNYNLVVSVRNKNNETVAENTNFFQRFNPTATAGLRSYESINIHNTFAERITSADTLREFIRSLTPIATELERIFINTQIKSVGLPILQQYFYNFWKERNEIEPEKAWTAYNLEVIKVNNTYSTQVRKGYETDMGRVYLQYGPPNNITDVPFETSGYQSDRVGGNTGSVPYQIWHYYTLNNNRERNKRFVFINSSLLAADYQLVHSDVNGEIQNYNWQAMLTRTLDIRDSDADEMRRDKSRSGTRYREGW